MEKKQKQQRDEKRKREDQEDEETRKLEEEKQELKGDLRNFEEVDYTQIKPPWIDADSGEVLDPEEVEVSMQKEKDSFEQN